MGFHSSFPVCRFLVIVWAVIKFGRPLVRPGYVPNNELQDFLSRVPDDEELADAREIRQGGADGGDAASKGSPASSARKRHR